MLAIIIRICIFQVDSYLEEVHYSEVHLGSYYQMAI